MEKELKYNAQKIGSVGQEELRKKIVRQKKKHGKSKEVAAIWECMVRHVKKTWKKYQEGGIEAIESVKMGRPIGKCCKLHEEQEAAIKEAIRDNSPVELGLAGHLWGLAEVSELIKRRFGIEMALTTTGDYLKRWSFTYQRPKKGVPARRRSSERMARSDIPRDSEVSRRRESRDMVDR
jgi:transposase